MAVQRYTSTASTPTASVTSFAVSTGTRVTGYVEFVVLTTQGTHAVTPPAGWTLQLETNFFGGTVNQKVRIYSRKRVAGDPTGTLVFAFGGTMDRADAMWVSYVDADPRIRDYSITYGTETIAGYSDHNSPTIDFTGESRTGYALWQISSCVLTAAGSTSTPWVNNVAGETTYGNATSNVSLTGQGGYSRRTYASDLLKAGPTSDTEVPVSTIQHRVSTSTTTTFTHEYAAISFVLADTPSADQVVSTPAARQRLAATPGYYGTGATVRTSASRNRLRSTPAGIGAGVGPVAPRMRLRGVAPQIKAAASVGAVSSKQRLRSTGEVTVYFNGLFAKSGKMKLKMPIPTAYVYIRDPAPVYTEAEYRKRFSAGQVNVTRRVEILESDGKTLWNDTYGNKSRLIGGSVSVDYERDERRSLDLTLANFDKGLTHRPDGFWYDKRLRLFRGIEFWDSSGKRSYEVQIGCFMMDNVKEQRHPGTVAITGRDYTKKCLLSKMVRSTTFAANQTISTVVKALAANSGVFDYLIPDTPETLGQDYTFEAGTERWKAMVDIAKASNYELYFNSQGYLVMRKFIDPTLGPVSNTFAIGREAGNLVDWSKSMNDTRIFNHVAVVGKDPVSEVPIYASAKNENPASPTRIAKLGERVMDPYNSDFINSQSQAQALADTFLKINGLEEFNIEFESLVFPWMEVGEITQFDDPNGYPNQPNKFLITSLTIPLDLGTMSASGRRVTVVG